MYRLLQIVLRTVMPLVSIVSVVAGDEASGQTRYLDEIFPSVSIDRGIPYGRAVAGPGDTITLLLDLRKPAGDTVTRRPLMLLAHGGGFSSGSRTDPQLDSLGDRFARRGWLVASIDYRLLPVVDDELTALLGAIQGVQDMRSALRFFHRYAARYGVDTTRIVAGGFSAGAIMALHAAFIDSTEEPLVADPALLKALGGLDGESGNAGYSSQVAAVVNYWGGIVDTALITPGDIPVVSIHGTRDPTIPYEYLERSPWDTVGSLLYGSAPITRTARRVGLPTDLLPFEGYAHGIGAADSREHEEATRFIADFLWQNLFASVSSARRDEEASFDLDLR